MLIIIILHNLVRFLVHIAVYGYIDIRYGRGFLHNFWVFKSLSWDILKILPKSKKIFHSKLTSPNLLVEKFFIKKLHILHETLVKFDEWCSSSRNRRKKHKNEKFCVAYLSLFHVLIIFKAIYNNMGKRVREKREQFNEKKIRTWIIFFWVHKIVKI